MIKVYCKDCNKLLNHSAYSFGTIRCRSCNIKERHRLGIFNRKGENNPNYKDGKTNNNKCIDCGKGIWSAATRCKSCARRFQYKDPTKHPQYHVVKSPETIKKLSISLKKRCSTPEYRSFCSLRSGGTGIPYENREHPKEFSEELKNIVKTRDNFNCQMCGINEDEHLKSVGYILSVHHIDYDKKNNKEYNLITLCHSCHTKTNYNRSMWKEHFSDIFRGAAINE